MLYGSNGQVVRGGVQVLIEEGSCLGNNVIFRGKFTSVCGKNSLDSKSHRKIPAEQQKFLDFFHKNVVLHQWFILNTPSLSSTVIHTSKTSLLILLCYQRNSLQLFRGKKSLRHCTFVNPIPQHSNTI